MFQVFHSFQEYRQGWTQACSRRITQASPRLQPYIPLWLALRQVLLLSLVPDRETSGQHPGGLPKVPRERLWPLWCAWSSIDSSTKCNRLWMRQSSCYDYRWDKAHAMIIDVTRLMQWLQMRQSSCDGYRWDKAHAMITDETKLMRWL
jgi:hypothetical protein